jgi:hypothetical protein
MDVDDEIWKSISANYSPMFRPSKNGSIFVYEVKFDSFRHTNNKYHRYRQLLASSECGRSFCWNHIFKRKFVKNSKHAAGIRANSDCAIVSSCGKKIQGAAKKWLVLSRFELG